MSEKKVSNSLLSSILLTSKGLNMFKKPIRN